MPEGYHDLTNDQRCQLYTLKERGDPPTAIAKLLGVHRSTICREIGRNTGRRGYRYKQAGQKALERRSAASNQKRKMIPSTIAFIHEKLKLQWSPEQISGWLKKNAPEMGVSHEIIYQQQ